MYLFDLMYSFDVQCQAFIIMSLQWGHNGHGSVLNHQPHNCLLNCLFRCRSKKTSKICVTGLCAGNSPRGPVKSPHKWPVTRKMLTLDDIIMVWLLCYISYILMFGDNRYLPRWIEFSWSEHVFNEETNWKSKLVWNPNEYICIPDVRNHKQLIYHFVCLKLGGLKQYHAVIWPF